MCQYYSSTVKMVLVLFFFSSSVIHQSHKLVRYHATGINYLLICFLHALHCLYLLHQAISLTWILILGSPSSKLSLSRSILSKFIVLRPISYMSWVLCLSRQYLSGSFFGSNFIWYFFCLISIKNRIKCKRTSINSFITNFLSLKSIKEKLYYWKYNDSGIKLDNKKYNQKLPHF